MQFAERGVHLPVWLRDYLPGWQRVAALAFNDSWNDLAAPISIDSADADLRDTRARLSTGLSLSFFFLLYRQFQRSRPMPPPPFDNSFPSFVNSAEPGDRT